MLKNKITKGVLIVCAALVVFVSIIAALSPSPKKVQPATTINTQQTQTPNAQTPTTNTNLQDTTTQTQTGTVVSITDGDTLRVNVNGTEMNIRLIGIDAPEINHPTEPIQCYSPEAKTALENLILNQEVTLEKDVSDKDQYDRFLRYIWFGETLVNEYMTQNGFAFASKYPPDTKYQVRIAAAEAAARSGGAGLWAVDTCDGNVYTGTYKDLNKVVEPAVVPSPIKKGPDIPPPGYVDSSE